MLAKAPIYRVEAQMASCEELDDIRAEISRQPDGMDLTICNICHLPNGTDAFTHGSNNHPQHIDAVVRSKYGGDREEAETKIKAKEAGLLRVVVVELTADFYKNRIDAIHKTVLESDIPPPPISGLPMFPAEICTIDQCRRGFLVHGSLQSHTRTSHHRSKSCAAFRMGWVQVLRLGGGRVYCPVRMWVCGCFVVLGVRVCVGVPSLG